MTKQEFERLYGNNVGVHCDTEEKANHFLALAYSVGYKWDNNVESIIFNLWKIHEEETCYEITDDSLLFSSFEFYKNENRQIIEYQLQPKLKVGDLEKVEEPTYEEETIDDIIEEIQERQKSINVLLNRLNYKLKKGKIK